MSNLDPRDFIDPDEGYRNTDWDSHLRSDEAFYTEALPCESCGRPVDCERKPAEWDPELLVGPCCQFSFDIPELENAPTCPTLWEAVYRCKSVAEVSAAMDAHVMSCPVCGEKRKQILSETPVRPEEKRRAA